MEPDDLARIAHTYGIRLLLQFGSSVTGHMHPRSDVDLGVLLDRPRLSLGEHAELVHALPRRVPEHEVELVTRKLVLIVDDLRAVTSLASKTLDEYLASPTDEILTERYLERTIGRMIDVNYHLITEGGYESFT